MNWYYLIAKRDWWESFKSFPFFVLFFRPVCEISFSIKNKNKKIKTKQKPKKHLIKQKGELLKFTMFPLAESKSCWEEKTEPSISESSATSRPSALGNRLHFF